jgi:hypothetical protein
VCEAFLSYVQRRVFPGGCFFAAAALEMGTHPGPVKERVAAIQSGFTALLRAISATALEQHQLPAREDPDRLAFELLSAYERELPGDPYVTLLRAKGMQRVALQFWHVGAARTKANREAQAEARHSCIRSCFRPTLLSLSHRGGGDRKSVMTVARSPDRAD